MRAANARGEALKLSEDELITTTNRGRLGWIAAAETVAACV